MQLAGLRLLKNLLKEKILLFRPVVLFLVMDPEWNVYDQRVMEYATEAISQHGYEYPEGTRVVSPCLVIRRSLEQLHGITLTENKALFV